MRIPPAEITRVKTMLGRGYGPLEVAQRLKMDPRRVHGIVARHVEMPREFTLLTHVAVEVGVTAYMLRNHAQRGNLPARRWAGRLVYTREQAEAVRAYYRTHGTPESSWLTATQTARELGCDLKRLSRVRMRIERQQGVEIRRVKLKAASGNTWRYCPEDVARAARCQPRLFRGRPRDHVSAKHLADMAGLLTPSPASTWALKGCPHVKDHLRRLWFRPEAVLAWLRARPPHHQTAPVIARLSALLEVGRAA